MVGGWTKPPRSPCRKPHLSGKKWVYRQDQVEGSPALPPQDKDRPLLGWGKRRGRGQGQTPRGELSWKQEPDASPATAGRGGVADGQPLHLKVPHSRVQAHPSWERVCLGILRRGDTVGCSLYDTEGLLTGPPDTLLKMCVQPQVQET